MDSDIDLLKRSMSKEENTMFTFIIKGGPVMWPIIGCAIIALSIIIERIIYFFFTGTDYERFRDALVQSITSQHLDKVSLKRRANSTGKKFLITRLFEWISNQRWNRSAYVKVSTVYIDNISRGHRSREESLKRIGSEEIERMERNFSALSAISHISPLLGLLGTVTGIINAFTVISELQGQVDVSALAGGIWEAMITTAAGLIVAIPSHLAYLSFEKIVSSRANRMSYTITYLNEILFSNRSNQELMHDSTPVEGSEIIKQVHYAEESTADER